MSDSGSSNTTAVYEIVMSGKTITQSDSQGLERIEVEAHIDRIGFARFTFGDGLTDWSSFKQGDDVEVKVGGSSEMVFKGHVTALRHVFQNGRDLLTVIAMDPLCKLAGTCRVAIFEEKTDSDIINSVFGSAGVTAGTVDSTSGASKYVLQRNESDFVFARRLAARNGYWLRANQGKIDFVKAQYSGNATDIPKGNLIALDYTFNDRNVPQNVVVRGWDYVKKEVVEGSAGAGDLDTVGSGTDAVAGGGKIWAGDLYLGDVSVNTQDGAKAVAASELNRRARNFLRGRCIMQGNATFIVGGKIKFSGHRDGFNPDGFIFSIRHIVEIKRGFHTEIGFCGNTWAGTAVAGADAGEVPVATPTTATQGAVSALDPNATAGALNDALGDATSALADAASAAEAAAADALAAADGALGDVLEAVGEVVEAVEDAVSAALDALEEAIDAAAGAIGTAIDALVAAAEAIGEVVSEVIGAIIGALAAVSDALGDLAAAVGSVGTATESGSSEASYYAAEAVAQATITLDVAISNANEAIDAAIVEVVETSDELDATPAVSAAADAETLASEAEELAETMDMEEASSEAQEAMEQLEAMVAEALSAATAATAAATAAEAAAADGNGGGSLQAARLVLAGAISTAVRARGSASSAKKNVVMILEQEAARRRAQNATGSGMSMADKLAAARAAQAALLAAANAGAAAAAAAMDAANRQALSSAQSATGSGISPADKLAAARAAAAALAAAAGAASAALAAAAAAAVNASRAETLGEEADAVADPAKLAAAIAASAALALAAGVASAGMAAAAAAAAAAVKAETLEEEEEAEADPDKMEAAKAASAALAASAGVAAAGTAAAAAAVSAAVKAETLDEEEDSDERQEDKDAQMAAMNESENEAFKETQADNADGDID
jgi:phage protein D